MKFGEMVKIEDIGVLAMFIRRNRNEVELEMFGERFWLPAHLVHPVIEEEAA